MEQRILSSLLVTDESFYSSQVSHPTEGGIQSRIQNDVPTFSDLGFCNFQLTMASGSKKYELREIRVTISLLFSDDENFIPHVSSFFCIEISPTLHCTSDELYVLFT
jgi:hypothetical protein